jgi:hypothetical protein
MYVVYLCKQIAKKVFLEEKYRYFFRRLEFSWNGIWKLENDYRDNSKEGHMTLWTAEHVEKEVANNNKPKETKQIFWH